MSYLTILSSDLRWLGVLKAYLVEFRPYRKAEAARAVSSENSGYSFAAASDLRVHAMDTRCKGDRRSGKPDLLVLRA